jgi:hypothetical protein
MKKMMIAAGAAIVCLSLATLGYAVQGQPDTGGASGQVSPSTPGASTPDPSKMGSDPAAQPDTSTKPQKKKGKSSSESSLGMEKDQNADVGKSGSKAGKAPAPPAEGSNPSLDKTGKGSASGG